MHRSHERRTDKPYAYRVRAVNVRHRTARLTAPAWRLSRRLRRGLRLTCLDVSRDAAISTLRAHLVRPLRRTRLFLGVCGLAVQSPAASPLFFSRHSRASSPNASSDQRRDPTAGFFSRAFTSERRVKREGERKRCYRGERREEPSNTFGIGLLSFVEKILCFRSITLSRFNQFLQWSPALTAFQSFPIAFF